MQLPPPPHQSVVVKGEEHFGEELCFAKYWESEVLEKHYHD